MYMYNTYIHPPSGNAECAVPQPANPSPTLRCCLTTEYTDEKPQLPRLLITTDGIGYTNIFPSSNNAASSPFQLSTLRIVHAYRD